MCTLLYDQCLFEFAQSMFIYHLSIYLISVILVQKAFTLTWGLQQAAGRRCASIIDFLRIFGWSIFIHCWRTR